MHARNKRTGAAIVGTLERISGRAGIVADSFKFDAAGRLIDTESTDEEPGFDWTGSTEIFYDEQRTQRDGAGRTVFLDDQGEECTADDIEAYEPDDEEAQEERGDLGDEDERGTRPNAAEIATERRMP